MPVSVKAHLLRGGVYVAGERVYCQIHLTNDNVNSSTEMLAWASAQIICQCSAAYGITSTAGTDEGAHATHTSFVASQGESGFTAMSTPPSILFCNLILASGESRSFVHEDRIPLDAAPSYRGQSVKYTYKLVLGISRLSAPAKLLRLPFRVLSIQQAVARSNHVINNNQPPISPLVLGNKLFEPPPVPTVDEMPVGSLAGRLASEAAALLPTNPFLEEENNVSAEDLELEQALALLSAATSRRLPSNYNISNSSGHVLRLTVPRQNFRLGEDIVLLLDFSRATVQCLEVTVTLQSEEQSLVVSNTASIGAAKPLVTSHATQRVTCLHTAHCHISLSVAPTLTPAFVTELVRLRWRLHLELVTISSNNDVTLSNSRNLSSEAYAWRPPTMVDTELLAWDLPVRLLAASPVQLFPSSQLRATDPVLLVI